MKVSIVWKAPHPPPPSPREFGQRLNRMTKSFGPNSRGEREPLLGWGLSKPQRLIQTPTFDQINLYADVVDDSVDHKVDQVLNCFG